MKYTLIVGLLLLSAIAAWGEDPSWLPEDPLKGHRVFEDKSCSKCHSILGDQPGIGPDLGKDLVFGSFFDLAATMWNHSPRMSNVMRQNYIQRPEFLSEEFKELATFLYYLRYLGEPGNLTRGKRLLSEKGCLSCHALAGQGGDRAPDLEQMTVYASPLFLVQAMWNHGPEMETEMRSLELTRPRFEGREILDLGAYIRSLTREGRKESVYMTPGNPRQGELWNHGPEMWLRMSELGLPEPTFNGAEMADVIAYIFYVKFAGEPGYSRRCTASNVTYREEVVPVPT
jgi:mono/diheme cytochrome c family protein